MCNVDVFVHLDTYVDMRIDPEQTSNGQLDFLMTMWEALLMTRSIYYGFLPRSGSWPLTRSLNPVTGRCAATASSSWAKHRTRRHHRCHLSCRHLLRHHQHRLHRYHHRHRRRKVRSRVRHLDHRRSRARLPRHHRRRHHRRHRGVHRCIHHRPFLHHHLHPTLQPLGWCSAAQLERRRWS